MCHVAEIESVIIDSFNLRFEIVFDTRIVLTAVNTSKFWLHTANKKVSLAAATASLGTGSNVGCLR